MIAANTALNVIFTKIRHNIDFFKVTKPGNLVSLPYSLITIANLEAKESILLPEFYVTIPLGCAL